MGREFLSSSEDSEAREPLPAAAGDNPAEEGTDEASTVELVSFAPSAGTMDGPLEGGTGDTFYEQQRRRRRIIFGAVLALVVILLFAAPTFYRDFKAWNATRLARQGEQMILLGRTEEAVSDIRAAFILSPDAPEVVRAMAQMLTAFSSSEAMTYWNWLIAGKNGTDDDRRDAVVCAMNSGLYSEACNILNDLLKRDGGDSRNALLAARWSTQRGTPAQTIYFATKAVQDDPTSKDAALFLAAQEISNPYLHQKGIDTLFQLAEADDNFGIMALHILCLDRTLKPGEVDRLIVRLQSHALAGTTERLNALSFEIGRHPDERDALIDNAVAENLKDSPADLTTFGQWLNENHESEQVFRLITREQAMSDTGLFSDYIDALGLLNRWAELKRLLSVPHLPIEVPIAELYLSQCASEMGDDKASDFHWHNAVAAAANNPTISLRLALYAEKHHQGDRAAALYRHLTPDPMTARMAYMGLWRVLMNEDTQARCNLLDEIVLRWPQDREMMNEDTCLHLLLNQRVPEMYQRALTMLAEDENSLSHHTNVALACLRLRDPAGALHAYDGISVDWNKAPVVDRIVYALTLKANGQTHAARLLMIPVDRKALRPEISDLINSIS
jgi:hypothetical protein